MREPNFICPESGEEFFIPTFSTVIRANGPFYKDKYGKEVVHPESGARLEPITKEGSPTIFPSEADRIKKTHAYFKARSKKHAASDEAKYEKKQVKDREMSNMGYESVKKKKK